MTRYFITILAIPAFCIFMIAFEKPAAADTHYVNAGQSIQSAIDDANNGDQIEVAPGTYNEAINFNGKAVRLYSSSGPAVTTIDANGIAGAYHVVQCVSGEDANTILEGFTITGGNANGGNWPDFYGGGMFNFSSSPTVTNCTFSGNTANWYGGGMYNYNSSPTVTDCTFSGNSAPNGSGGGMENDSSSSPTLIDCNFTSNTAKAGGGGMRNYYSNPVLTNCTFTNNSTSGSIDAHGGGIVNVQSSSPTLTGCRFCSNKASLYGGGIINSVNCSPTIVNCLFYDNSANQGGGIYNNDHSNPILTNCTFYGNIGNIAESFGGMYSINVSSPIVTNCIFWNDTPGEIYIFILANITYSTVQLFDGNHDGEPDSDPCFVDVNAGDFRLKPDSPCIDAGNNTAVPGAILKDLAGKLRFADDPYTFDTGIAGTTGRPVVDMGAYEFQGCGAIPQNLLANPGFETGTATGWITNWGWNLTATTEQVHDGNYSGLASGRTASWQGAWQSVKGLMDDGKTYRISGWVMLQNADSNYVALTVKKNDATGTHYYPIDDATGYRNQWIHLDGTVAIDIVEPVTELFVYFEGPSPGVDFYVDDVAVTEVMGDMNHNGSVNFVDFSLFASYYGFDCSTQDCGRANLCDCDNTIDVLDLAILANHWLEGS